MESGKAISKTTGRLPAYGLRKIGGALFDVANYLFLIAFSLSVLYPLWTTILLSFSGVEDATTLGFHLWIDSWNLSAYEFAMSRYGNAQVAYFNSIFRTVVGTFLTVFWTLLAAYPLSKKNLPGRNVLTIIILMTMFFSGGLIPFYFLIKNIGLYDTRWALILPGMAVGFYTLIMRNFLMTIDDAYEEAAFMDGASYLLILFRVIIPLSKPVLAVVALWTAVSHWNAWFDALIFLKSESKIVLQLLLRRLIQDLVPIRDALGQFVDRKRVELPTEAVKAAIAILTIGPIILVYPFVQRYFVKGVFIGSLKG